MLLGQHRGGHQNGHLLAVQHRLHHRPQGHLRLAEAHVAAQKPVHGYGGLHIPLDFRDAAELIVGFGVGEVVFKFLLPGGIGGKGVAGLPLPGGIELDELVGHIPGGFSRLGFGLLPGVGAHFVQLYRGVVSAAADVFADKVKLGGGDIENVGALVGDFDIILHRAVHPNLLHGHIPSNAVLVMDHQVAGGQVREGSQLLPVGGAGFLGLCLGGLPDHKLALRENRQLQIGVLHAEGQVPLRQKDLAGSGHGGQGKGQKAAQALVPEHGLQQLRPPAGAAQHQTAEVQLLVVGQVRGGDLQITAVAGKLLGRQIQ